MLAEELYLKSVLYDLLARGFDYPDDELAASLTTSNQEESFPAAGASCRPLSDGALAENLGAIEDFIPAAASPRTSPRAAKDYTRACFASARALASL